MKKRENMYIEQVIRRYKNKKIKLYVDMDGVIADYEVGNASDFHLKRPLISNISKLEVISKINNVELFILSITRMDEGFEQKQMWLDKNAPFFKKENRVIISRESNEFINSDDLKAQYVKNLKRDGSLIIVIDDDPRVLFKIKELCEDVVLLKDTVLVD